LRTPVDRFSTPTSANQEDHVSMAAHGARRLGPMTENLSRHPGGRVAVRRAGGGFPRAAAHLAPLRAVVARLRADVATLGEDRYLAPDIEAARAAGRLGRHRASGGRGPAGPVGMTPVEVTPATAR
jgi:histidine ammonia-lyase